MNLSGVSEIVVSSIIIKYEEGKSIASLAELFGLSKRLVRSILVDNNIEIRHGNKIKSTEKSSVDLFFNKVHTKESHSITMSFSDWYKVYFGFCKCENIKFESPVFFFQKTKTRANMNNIDLDKIVPASNHKLISLQINQSLSNDMLKYYQSFASKSEMRKHFDNDNWSRYENDSFKFVSKEISAEEFEKNWYSVYLLFYGFTESQVIDFTKKKFSSNDSTHEDNINEVSTETTHEETCDNQIQDSVCENNVNNKNESTKDELENIKSFRSFKHLFIKVEPLKSIVTTILCDRRHNVKGVVPNVDFEAPIFHPLNEQQMNNYDWMEKKVGNWIDTHIMFDENGNPKQDLRVYTTGYNPLNAVTIAAAYQRGITLYNMYYDERRDTYHEHKLFNNINRNKELYDVINIKENGYMYKQDDIDICDFYDINVSYTNNDYHFAINGLSKTRKYVELLQQILCENYSIKVIYYKDFKGREIFSCMEDIMWMQTEES